MTEEPLPQEESLPPEEPLANEPLPGETLASGQPVPDEGSSHEPPSLGLPTAPEEEQPDIVDLDADEGRKRGGGRRDERVARGPILRDRGGGRVAWRALGSLGCQAGSRPDGGSSAGACRGTSPGTLELLVLRRCERGSRQPRPAKVVIANGGSEEVSAHVTVVSDTGASRAEDVEVPPYSTGAVPETAGRGSAWVGAIVDVDAGAVAVAQEVTAKLGRSFSPSATSGSGAWYFPTGSTLINADTEISLLNPYPVDSIVDLSFTTDQGVETPENFQGLAVPARGMLSVDFRGQMRRRSGIATTVSVRTGSVVAWETAWTVAPERGAVLVGSPAARNPLADPAAPTAGLTVTLGAPSTGPMWSWADGLTGSGIDESYAVYNPSPTTADVRLSLNLEEGVAEPFDFSVGGYQVVEMVSSGQARIPAGVAHSATLDSLNGVPVVAARAVVAAKSSPSQTGPPSQSGLGEILGIRVSGKRWLVPATASGRGGDAQLCLYARARLPGGSRSMPWSTAGKSRSAMRRDTRSVRQRGSQSRCWPPRPMATLW